MYFSDNLTEGHNFGGVVSCMNAAKISEHCAVRPGPFGGAMRAAVMFVVSCRAAGFRGRGRSAIWLRDASCGARAGGRETVGMNYDRRTHNPEARSSDRRPDRGGSAGFAQDRISARAAWPACACAGNSPRANYSEIAASIHGDRGVVIP